MGSGLAGTLLPAVWFGTELIFGRPVPDLEIRWDSLRGWQRGLIGAVLALVLFAIGGIIGVAMAGLTLLLDFVPCRLTIRSSEQAGCVRLPLGS